jgi:hypothetical protein
LGGTIREREKGRFEIANVPVNIRRRDRQIGNREPVLDKYERITFTKELIAPQGKAPAAFVCPGHPLFDSTVDIVLERYKGLLRHGAILVDRNDHGTAAKVMLYMRHAIQDGTTTARGEQRVISERMLFVARSKDGKVQNYNFAPYLDLSPLTDKDPDVESILARPECSWVTRDLERAAVSHALQTLVPEHLKEIRDQRIALLDKTEAAVKMRLNEAIRHWDHRSNELRQKEEAGKSRSRLNSNEARRRADELSRRLSDRLDQIKAERLISPRAPVALGGVLIVPQGLLDQIRGIYSSASSHPTDTQISAAKARSAVMEVERKLGFEPVDKELEKLGYDIESRDPKSGKLRFIEVKGRVAGADTITVTQNEILFSLNSPEGFILAMVEFSPDGTERVRYLRQPFKKEPDFNVVSVNYKFAELFAIAVEPL